MNSVLVYTPDREKADKAGAALSGLAKQYDFELTTDWGELVRRARRHVIPVVVFGPGVRRKAELATIINHAQPRSLIVIMGKTTQQVVQACQKAGAWKMTGSDNWNNIIKLIEDAFQVANQHYQPEILPELFCDCVMGHYAFNGKHQLVAYNRAGALLYLHSCKKELVPGILWEDFCPQTFNEIPIHTLLKDQLPIQREVQLDGGWLQIFVKPMQLEGQGFSITVRDITQQKRLDEDLENQAQAMEKARSEYEKLALSMINDKEAVEKETKGIAGWVAGVAHDIRNQLQGLFMEVENLQQKPDVATVESLARHVGLYREQILAGVGEIIDTGRLLSHKTRLTVQASLIHIPVMQAVKVLQPRAAAKQLYLDYQQQELPSVQFDNNLLYRLVYNLVHNAIKYTDDGGIKVSLLLKPRPDNRATLTLVVKDTGVGLAPDVQEALFKPFAPGHEIGSGTGIGLYTVKEICRLLNGRIKVDTKPGLGTEFRISFSNRQLVDDVEMVAQKSIATPIDLPTVNLESINIIKSQLADVRQMSEIEKTASFAELLLMEGNHYRHPLLLDWGKQLKTAIAECNLEMVQKVLGHCEREMSTWSQEA